MQQDRLHQALIKALEETKTRGQQSVMRNMVTQLPRIIAVRYDAGKGKRFGIYEVARAAAGPHDAMRSATAEFGPEAGLATETMIGDLREDGDMFDMPHGAEATPDFMVTLDRETGTDQYLVCRWVSWAGGVKDAARTMAAQMRERPS